MGNAESQIKTDTNLRDLATTVALNFVGHSISSSDGSYDLLITVVYDALGDAVNADRKSRPHPFEGRTDRGCDLCGESDRDTIHCYSREHSARFVEAAKTEQAKITAQAEREECVKIVQKTYEEWFNGDQGHGTAEAFRLAVDRIRARGNE